METVQILLGTMIALLLSLAVLGYLLIKEAKSIVAGNQKISGKLDEVITVKKASDEKQLELIRRIIEENTSNSRMLGDIVNNTYGRLREQIHAEIEHVIEVKNYGDQKLIEILVKLLDENLNMHKTLQEVIDLEKELSSK